MAEPLDAAYQQILDLKQNLSVDAIFDALNEMLESLGVDLEEGLDRTAKAFNGLLAALPSVSAPISVEVELGF